MYCGKTCQLNDWKNGHKARCGKDITLQQHVPACAYAFNNPKVTNDNCVSTGQLLLVNQPDYVVTTGLNTCIFIVVNTTVCTLAWHASLVSTQGLPTFQSNVIGSFRSQFKKIGNSYGKFVRGFIIPGVDRDENLNLKPTCRTMRELAPDPTESKRLILGFLKEFKWYNLMVTVSPPSSYKDFVVVDPTHNRPFYFSDVAQFDAGCTYDAEIE